MTSNGVLIAGAGIGGLTAALALAREGIEVTLFDQAETLAEAAKILSREPASLQLRYLQTLADISGEKSSTIVFPLPIDLIAPLLQTLNRPDAGR